MKTDVEKLDPTRVRLSVEVPFDELKPSLDSAYRQIGRQVRVPGFRPGKVPQRVIDARVGRGAVLEQAINDAIPGFYSSAVEEAGIKVLGQPEVDVTNLDDGASLTFTAEVDVRPEFDLTPRDTVEVTVENVTVEDTEVDEQVDALRERFATAITVERPAADGDVVTIDLAATTLDGEPLEGGEVAGQSYKVGSGTMLDGLDEAVTGTSAGETATFATTLVGGAAGQEANVTITVTAVKEQQLPELDDEFAQLASEFDTVDELRADTRTRLERVARRRQLVAARDQVLEAYLAGLDVPVPTRLLAHELEHRTGDLDRELESYGLTKEQYVTTMGTTVEEFDAENEQRATTAIRAQFVLDAIAAEEGLELDQGEVSQQIITRAARAGVSPEQYAQQLVEANQVNALISDVLRAKALAALVRAATVKDADGNTLDVDALEAELAAQSGGGRTIPADQATGQVEVVDEGYEDVEQFDEDDEDDDGSSAGFGVGDIGDEYTVLDEDSPGVEVPSDSDAADTVAEAVDAPALEPAGDDSAGDESAGDESSADESGAARD